MTELSEHNLDHICWLIHYSQADHRQRAEYERDENSDEEQFQYHAGIHNGIESVRDLIEEYGIDVEARAKRFVEESESEISITPE